MTTVKIANSDFFEKNEHVTYTDIPDGLAVHDTQDDAVHFLNPVAGTIFLLCDGAHDANSIAVILREEFGLESEPIEDVLNCLTNLEAENLIRKFSQ